MAEVIERHLESMINEIEEMKRVKLFTIEETKNIIKRRKEYEYKVNGRTKHLKDYQNYIDYELGLISQIRNRRDKHQIGEKKRTIEYRILQRIKRLYELAIQRYSDDFNLRLTYFKFCKEFNFITPASRAIDSMLKNFTHEPNVWIIGALWFAKEKGDLNRALTIIHKGLTIHKNNQMLYKEAIKLEISRVGSDDDEKLLQKVADKIQVYVKAILQFTNDYKFLTDILLMLERYDFTKEVQNMITEKLIENYSDYAVVWDALARREWRGFHYNPNITDENEKSFDNFQLAVDKYREGLSKLSTNEKKILWQKFIEFALDIPANDINFSRKFVKSLFNEASDESALTEDLYIKWLELVSDEEAFEILEKGVKTSPKCQVLWKLRLQLALSTGGVDEARDIFDEAVRNLQGDALPIWLIYLENNNNNDEIVESLYKKGIKESEQISNILKIDYLKWLTKIKGIAEARKLYKQICNDKPYNKNLHDVMLRLESEQKKVDTEFCNYIFQIACNQFGKQNMNLWINYILFHLKFNESGDVNDLVQRIFQQAQNTLDSCYLNDFREKYNDVLIGSITDFI